MPSQARLAEQEKWHTLHPVGEKGAPAAPTGAEANLQARVLLVKGYRQHFTESDYDFKRFHVDAEQMKDAKPTPEKQP